MIYCSKRALIDICRGMILQDIPPEIREIITGVKCSGQVPIQVLRDMVLDPENHRSVPARPSTEFDGAGQMLLDNTTVTQMATLSGCRNSAKADQTVLFSENQPREPQAARIGIVTNQGEYAQAAQTKDSGKGPSTEVLLTSKDKDASFLEKGFCLGGDQNTIAIHEANKHKAKERQPGRRPQKIQSGDKTAVTSRNLGRPPVKTMCTSRHNRFAGRMGRGRGRGSIGDPAQFKHKPGQGPKKLLIGQGGPKTTRAMQNQGMKGKTNQLINVPVQLSSSPIQQCTSPHLHNTQPKRKPSADGANRTDASGPKKKLLVTREASSSDPPATVQLDPTGFFEVRISSTHAETIGAGCGLTEKEILQTLKEDNEERRAQMEMEVVEGEEDLQLTPAEWEDLRRFDLDPADALDTDQED